MNWSNLKKKFLINFETIFWKRDDFDKKLISLILRALPTFKDTIVINRLLLMYSWIENPIWILNPTLDLGPWNVKWSRSNPPPRINPSNPLFRFRRIFNRNPPSMTFSRIGSHVTYPRKSSKISSKDGIRSTWLGGMSSGFRAENFAAADWLPEKVISPAHSRTNSSPVIIVIVNSHLFGFKRLTF